MKIKILRHGLLWVIVAIIIQASVMYYPLCFGDELLFSTDDNIGLVAAGKRLLPAVFIGGWSDLSLFGSPNGLWPFVWINLLIWALPAVVFTNCIHALDMCLGSFLLCVFLRQSKVNVIPAVIAAFSAFWIGCNMTLIYSGHIPKFDILMLSTVLLLCISRCAAMRQPLWGVLAGGTVGLMFLEQMDVALFFGIFLGAYAVFKIVRMTEVSWARRLWLYLAPMGLIALWIAGPTLSQGYAQNIKGVSQVNNEDPQAKWEFVTQWSQPPDETIDFIAPGYMGWRSGEPEGPYWGRSGRSAEWEQTRQGFMNFRLDCIYIGAIPMVLALFAFVAALCAKRKPGDAEVSGAEWNDRRAEILFWGAVAIITLLLAYGKFTPLYWLFYQLPVVNNIRVPAKFIQVFQVALAILAAYGFDFAVQWAKRRKISVRQ